MYYRATGFSPDEERELLTAARGEVAEEKKIDEILEFTRKQDQIRMVMTVGVVAGLVFTLTRFGDLVAEMRRRRREST
jgi:hypothetical protein